MSAHPCYERAVLIYRNARKDWAAMESIREAALTLGMGERQYCDARLTANQFQPYTASSTDARWITQEDLDRAYAEAAERADRPGGGPARDTT